MLFISCMLYMLYTSFIVSIVSIVNKQITPIPLTFEKLATPLTALTVKSILITFDRVIVFLRDILI